MTTIPSVSFDNGVFKIFGDSGEVVFDSDYQSQRILIQGSLDIAGRGSLDNSKVSEVLYGKTFDLIPYVKSVSRKTGSAYVNGTGWPGTNQPGTTRIFPPYIRYYVSSGTMSYDYIQGHYTNAKKSSVYIGNLDCTNGSPSMNGSRRVWYAVFDNPIGMS